MVSWSDIPQDLYARRSKDRIFKIIFGLVRMYEGATQLSQWRPDKVEPVDRVMEGIITAREEIADDVVKLTFKEKDNGLFPVWNPGAHIDVLLPSGKVRQYSLTGDPGRRTDYTIAVRRIPHGGGGSLEMHSTYAVGDSIRFEGPRNAFHFCTDSGRVLFIIGGIGITPIMPMIKLAQLRKLDWHAVYAGRSRKAMPFVEELVNIDPERVTVWSDEEKGTFAQAEELLSWADEYTSLYLCGPIPMMEAVLEKRNPIFPGPLYYERFSPPPVFNEEPFTLELAKSQTTLEVPGDRSALDVMLDYNPHFAHSCRQGFCGTCKVKVLEGKVKHRAKGYETEDEILICMSRAAGKKLVIDS